MQNNYSVFIRQKDGTLIGRVNDFVSMHMLLTLNDPGTWSISSVTNENCPFSAGDGIIVVRNGGFFYGGVMTALSDEYDAVTGLHNWQVQGKGDLEYLNRRLCYVNPASSSPTSTSYYIASGTLSTIIRNLIRLNLGPDALFSRKEPIIEDYSQVAVGPYVSVKLRFQNLLKTVTALVSGNNYNIRANWNDSTNKVYYDVYQGRDLTDQIVFTDQLNNITGAEHIMNVPEGNYILAGGTGKGTSRQFQSAQDNDSISDWGLVEYFQDARNQNNLTGYADEVLINKTIDTIGYSCTASTEESTPQYGTDYILGDFVGMKIFGQFVTAEVQQCEISVEGGIEEVVPRFGTVAIGKLRNIFKQLSDLRDDVDELLGTEIE